MESTHDGSMTQDAVSLNNGSYDDSNRELRSETPPTQHRRGYQACDPCRKRKVKCDLGSASKPLLCHWFLLLLGNADGRSIHQVSITPDRRHV